MKKKILILAGLMMAWLPTAGFAQNEAELKAALAKKFLNTPVDEVRATPIPGIYEVTSGKNIYYVEKNLRYLMFGGMIDSQTGVNLTDARAQQLSRIDVSTLPVKDAITWGSGKRHLYIFSDPDCPYCKKLHPELAKLRDVTIHLFLYPIKELHPNAYYHGVAVWCSKDRKQALDDIFSGKPVEDAVCDNPVADNVSLGKKLGITGTPTLYFDDGSVQVGYATAEAVQAKLEGNPATNVSGSIGGETKEATR